MSAIDEAAFRGLLDDMGGDREVVRELVQSFLEEAPRMLAEGRLAVGEGRVADAQRAYHTLKGTAATFGALQVAEAARAIEQPAKSGVLPRPEAVAQVEALFAQARQELLRQLK